MISLTAFCATLCAQVITVMRKFYLAFCLLAFFSAVTAQPVQFTVRGKVTDKATGQPLVAASVFAQNTTSGTVTNAEGNFTLHLPAGGYELAITFTGYETVTYRVSSSDASGSDNILISLGQKDKTMETVAVVGTNEVKDGWEKYGNFFLENFIGRSAFSGTCVLKNPEVLKFYFSKRKNRLKVLSSEPLQIENQALGYKIKYTLDSFTYEYGTDVNTYTGYPLFEEMGTSDSLQLSNWKQNRLTAYRGSMLHFMRAVYNKKLKEEGYEIQFLVKGADQDQAIKLKDFYGALNYIKDDSTQTVLITPNQLNLGVLYLKEKPEEKYLQQAGAGEPAGFQFSFLTFLPQNPLEIEQNGYFYEQNDIAINGYWTWEKMADMLPYDYQPW